MKIVFTTFLLVFFAELGDKTQIAALSMAASGGKMLEVFIGASLALVAATLMAVFLGRWVSRHVRPEILKRVSAILFVATGGWLFLKAFGAL
ncbi:MAG TPA: TMEM165/GDT1 family protein [Spirochaetota bacterium]|nr:TMEM165/GDT1 family protein [Spirochaetota bacterium]